MSGLWHLILGYWLYLLGSLELGCRKSRLAFSVGVFFTEVRLCYCGLLTSTGNPIRPSRLSETIIQGDNAGTIL